MMTKPRIHILALGGTIATRPDASGAMQMGLGADDLVAAVPLLAKVADVQAETVSRVGSHSLSFDQIHALAARIRALKADGVVVTQGTDTLEETSFLLDVLLDLDIPVIVTAAMRNPALTSPDGPGNLLAAVRVAADPWVRKHARTLGVMVVMLDEAHAAADVVKAHGTRLNAFVSPQTGPLAALVEDRIVPLSLPVRDAMIAAHAKLGAADGKAAPVALFWMSLDEEGQLIETMLAASDRVGYRGAVIGAMGGGHTPERATATVIRLAQAMPTVIASDLWRGEFRDRAAQGRPDLGRPAASPEGTRTARDLPARQSRPAGPRRGVRRLRLNFYDQSRWVRRVGRILRGDPPFPGASLMICCFPIAPPCHPERSEGSRADANHRSLASLGMTPVGLVLSAEEEPLRRCRGLSAISASALLPLASRAGRGVPLFSRYFNRHLW